MEDPPSLLVDSNSPWQIPYSPLISEEPGFVLGAASYLVETLVGEAYDVERVRYLQSVGQLNRTGFPGECFT